MGRIASKNNNLKINFPKIAKEWHSKKNYEKKPENFLQNSHHLVWWLCKKGHEWETKIVTRTRQKSGCPYCVGKKPTKKNNLKVKYPELSKEWHPINNACRQQYQQGY